MRSIKLRSPAKINLFLEVLCKRKDSFHEIRTLFERISLYDEIVLRKSLSGIHVECSQNVGAHGRAPLPTNHRNLAYQAAQLLKNEFKIKTGVVIKIKKKIPVGAGLGGGSSNAAAVLLGLDRLWRLRLSQRKLMGLAARLGSDVPFFILETSFALAQGRGEILKKINLRPLKLWHCLVKPLFSISTRAAYRSLHLPKRRARLTPKNTDVRMLLRSIREGKAPALSGLLTNSLEHALNKRLTPILEIKKELIRQGASGSLMSGSGSSVFGIFSSQRKARTAARFMKRHRGWQVFVVSTL